MYVPSPFRHTISPSRIASFARSLPRDWQGGAKRSKTLSRREISLQRPSEMYATPRKPSCLSSKIQSGWSKASRSRVSVIREIVGVSSSG